MQDFFPELNSREIFFPNCKNSQKIQLEFPNFHGKISFYSQPESRKFGMGRIQKSLWNFPSNSPKKFPKYQKKLEKNVQNSPKKNLKKFWELLPIFLVHPDKISREFFWSRIFFFFFFPKKAKFLFPGIFEIFFSNSPWNSQLLNSHKIPNFGISGILGVFFPRKNLRRFQDFNGKMENFLNGKMNEIPAFSWKKTEKIPDFFWKKL